MEWKIMQKIAQKAKDNFNQGAVTMAFLGDSVTQGCFEIYRKNDGTLETVFDPEHAYHRYLAKIFSVLFPSVPVNIINAGISGGNASQGLERLERDVLCHRPDLTVVCFGLNDAWRGPDGIADYTRCLSGIFNALQENGSEVIFMTPNMMAAEVSCHLPEHFFPDARGAVKVQNDGIMDEYMDAARELCARMEVPVCDCYAKWKRLQASGADVTDLLANYINHPNRDLNWLFAISLTEMLLEF